MPNLSRFHILNGLANLFDHIIFCLATKNLFRYHILNGLVNLSASLKCSLKRLTVIFDIYNARRNIPYISWSKIQAVGMTYHIRLFMGFHYPTSHLLIGNGRE